MKTVVGMYKTVDEANKVKAALANEGYNSVRVIDQSEDGDYGTGYAGTGTVSNAANTATGAAETVGSKIKNFFSELSGHDEDTHQSYTSGVSGGGAMVAVSVSDEQVDRATEVLERYGATDVNGGGTGINAERESYADNRGTGYDNTATDRGTVTGEQVIPVVQEDLVVGKRAVERGGVRVFSHVVSQPASENVSLHDERVTVDRRNVNRPATDADFTDAGPIEVRAMGEEAVVSKTGRVVEEVVVGKQVSDRTEQVNENVRHTEVDVEPVETTTRRTDANYADATPTKKY